MSRCNAVDPDFAAKAGENLQVRELGPEDLEETLELLRGSRNLPKPTTGKTANGNSWPSAGSAAV